MIKPGKSSLSERCPLPAVMGLRERKKLDALAFVWAAVFLGLALLIGAALISARKDDLPAPEMALAV